MKKFVGLLVAVLMSAGLVASTGSVANADPYPGTIATNSKAKVPTAVLRGSRVALCGKVTAVNSNATPTGTLTFQVKRIGGGFSLSKTVAYGGGKVCISKKFKKVGAYVLRVEYNSPATSVFNTSSDAKGFRVFKKKR